MELVDGYYGKSHITADQVADLNIGTFGADSYVLSVGNALAHEIVTNNKVLIKDGAFVHQGRRGLIKAGTTETAIIANGAQNMKRNDFICIRYQKNTTTAVESFTLIVITGKSGTTAIDPVPVTGDIRAGETISDFPIYRVRISGLSIEGIDQLCSVLQPLRKVVSQSGWSPIEEHDAFIWSTPQSVAAPNFEVKTIERLLDSSRDLSSYLSVGMKIKLIQDGAPKYFFIVKMVGDRITLYGGTDYVLTSAVISDVAYSVVKSPHGFPLNPNKWSVQIIETADRNFNLVANTWKDTGMQLIVPIGNWIVSIKVMPVIQNAGSMYGAVMWCSFTDGSPMSTIPMSAIINSNVTSDVNMNGFMYLCDTIQADTNKIFKLHCRGIVNATGAISATGGPTVLKATCTYL